MAKTRFLQGTRTGGLGQLTYRVTVKKYLSNSGLRPMAATICLLTTYLLQTIAMSVLLPLILTKCRSRVPRQGLNGSRGLMRKSLMSIIRVREAHCGII